MPEQLKEIPIALSWAAVLTGLSIIAAAVLIGALLARRDVRRVNPPDVLRGP